MWLINKHSNECTRHRKFQTNLYTPKTWKWPQILIEHTIFFMLDQLYIMVISVVPQGSGGELIHVQSSIPIQNYVLLIHVCAMGTDLWHDSGMG